MTANNLTADPPGGTLRYTEVIDISTEDHVIAMGSNRGVKGLYIGTGGTVVGRVAGDTTDRTFVNTQSGSVLPVAFTVIRQTGTTASNMIAGV